MSGPDRIRDNDDGRLHIIDRDKLHCRCFALLL